MNDVRTTELLAELGPAVQPLTRAQYRTLSDAGFFAGRRVELLRGTIVEMASMGRPHLLAMQWLIRFVVRNLPDELIASPQMPFAASDTDEPEPDLLVVSTRWAQEQDDDDIPRAGHLLVEVAQTSLRRDLIVKAAIYAEAGIPEYWVIDLARRRAVVHTDPVDGVYTTIREVVPPATLDACDLSVPLGELFAFAHPDG